MTPRLYRPSMPIRFLVALPPRDLLLRAKHLFVAAIGRRRMPPRAEASSNLLFGGAGWRHARDNPTQARSAPQPRQAQKTHWQVRCIVRPVLCSRSKLTWLFGSTAAGQGQPASFDFAQPQHASLARAVVSDQPRLAGLAFLVALRAVPDLLLCAKHLFVAAIGGSSSVIGGRTAGPWGSEYFPVVAQLALGPRAGPLLRSSWPRGRPSLLSDRRPRAAAMMSKARPRDGRSSLTKVQSG